MWVCRKTAWLVVLAKAIFSALGADRPQAPAPRQGNIRLLLVGTSLKYRLSRNDIITDKFDIIANCQEQVIMSCVSGMQFSVLYFTTAVLAFAAHVACQNYPVPENDTLDTLESFEILPIEYEFICDGGIFGESVFTALTGGVNMQVLDPPRSDGLSHEQAYYDMIRLLEDGDAISAARLYQNDESARFLRAVSGLSNETMASNCTQAILDHYLSIRRTVSVPNYLRVLEEADATGRYSGSNPSVWMRYNSSPHMNRGPYWHDCKYLDTNFAWTPYKVSLNGVDCYRDVTGHL
ncbi:hypothetical protein V1517DRAFT_103388 [Lipomyces orientalis]|uniref:Uncharacterized protein n=1 Tax=Lipomyces orientalis TaxID=1233043 RepID=A0ACC3TY07_9ASCO